MYDAPSGRRIQILLQPYVSSLKKKKTSYDCKQNSFCLKCLKIKSPPKSTEKTNHSKNRHRLYFHVRMLMIPPSGCTCAKEPKHAFIRAQYNKETYRSIKWSHSPSPAVPIPQHDGKKTRLSQELILIQHQHTKRHFSSKKQTARNWTKPTICQLVTQQTVVTQTASSDIKHTTTSLSRTTSLKFLWTHTGRVPATPHHRTVSSSRPATQSASLFTKI